MRTYKENMLHYDRAWYKWKLEKAEARAKYWEEQFRKLSNAILQTVSTQERQLIPDNMDSRRICSGRKNIKAAKKDNSR
jgi:hypothetical protein